jgi:hypothetical protein
MMKSNRMLGSAQLLSCVCKSNRKTIEYYAWVHGVFKADKRLIIWILIDLNSIPYNECKINWMSELYIS